jgi:hypothetical protein
MTAAGWGMIRMHSVPAMLRCRFGVRVCTYKSPYSPA